MPAAVENGNHDHVLVFDEIKDSERKSLQ